MFVNKTKPRPRGWLRLAGDGPEIGEKGSVVLKAGRSSTCIDSFVTVPRPIQRVTPGLCRAACTRLSVFCVCAFMLTASRHVCDDYVAGCSRVCVCVFRLCSILSFSLSLCLLRSLYRVILKCTSIDTRTTKMVEMANL